MITSKSTQDFSSPFSPPHPAPRVPDHELARRIGCGSYGEVWLARGTVGAWRAIKVVYQSTFENARPFEREFSGIQRFEPISRSNEGFVDILQVGRNDEEKYFYYVMELADDAEDQNNTQGIYCPVKLGHARSIDPESYVPRTLALERTQRTRLPAGQCLQLAISLSLALDHLHRSGLIHRDIKPSNIVFVNGVPKLADIGLVAELGEAQSYVGTEGFIPPEGPNSAQADIYGLGKVLYEITTGKDRHDFPEPLTDLSENDDRQLLAELNAVVLKACHPDFRRRYSAAKQMYDDFMLLQIGKSVRTKRARERRVKTAAVAGAAALLAALAALAFDSVLDRRIGSLQGESNGVPVKLAGKVPARDRRSPKETIDLSPLYTASLTERWYPGPVDNTLASLPRGIQTFAGVKFDIRGLVQLSGEEISTYGADAYPSRARLPLGQWVKRLHFLQGSISEIAEGGTIATYRVRYRSGRVVDVPVVYGQDIRALWQPWNVSGEVPKAVLAWTGQNPPARERNLALRLYKRTWENPTPDDEVFGVEFISAGKNSAPFLVALTVDDHQPAAVQSKVPLDLVKALQSSATNFQKLVLSTNAQRLTPVRLNTRAIQIDGKYYDGLRISTPPGPTSDLVWAFTERKHLKFSQWHILPMHGGMKVGFEDWYHGLPESNAATNAPVEMTLQCLNGKKLEPATDYFIWFACSDAKPVEIEVALRFVPTGEFDPNKPETIAAALGLDSSNSNRLRFHRHYCLGAVR